MNIGSKLCVLVTLVSLVFAPGCVNDRTPVKSVQEQRDFTKYKPNRPRKSAGLARKAVWQALCAASALCGGGVLNIAGFFGSTQAITYSFFGGAIALAVLSGFLGYKSFNNFKKAHILHKQEQAAAAVVQPDFA